MFEAKLLGRPPKYRELVASLEDKELYAAASIAHFASTMGFIEETDATARKKAVARIRLAMMTHARSRLCPWGDGLLGVNGAMQVGWFGRTWKESYEWQYRLLDLEHVKESEA